MKKKLETSNKLIPYGKQKIIKRDIQEVNKVLKSNFLTQGPYVKKLEKGFEQFCNSKYAVAFNSATSALHAACVSLNLKKGDILWTSPITFVASANCAIYCGAKVDFIDIDPKTNNISIKNIETKLIQAQKKNKLPKIIIPVHLSGLSCEMYELYKLSKKYKFKIIEDASHAVGSKYDKSNVGSGKYSDITVFSLHPVKIITSAEGGLAITNKKLLKNKLSLFRTHGITKDKKEMKFKKNYQPWYYEQIDIGYNYRMSDIHAALGFSQLKSLNFFLKERKKIAKRYISSLKNLSIEIPTYEQIKNSSNHLFIIKFLGKRPEVLRAKIFKFLRKRNILVNVHYIPVYHHPYYKKMGFQKGYCPNAEKYYRSAISIPIYPSLSLADQFKIIKYIKSFF